MKLICASGAIPVPNQVMVATRGATDAFSNVGRHVNNSVGFPNICCLDDLVTSVVASFPTFLCPCWSYLQLRNLRAKNLEAGIGSGVGFGHGVGAGKYLNYRSTAYAILRCLLAFFSCKIDVSIDRFP